MASRDLYINLRPSSQQGAFVQSSKNLTAYTFSKFYREEAVAFRVFFLNLTPSAGISSPAEINGDLSAYSCKIAIGDIGGTVLAYEGLTWDSEESCFTGTLLINTTEMNAALDASSSGEITKTLEVELAYGGTEFTFHSPVTIRNEVIVNGGSLPTDVTDTIFADYLTSALVDSPEVDYVRDGDDVESHIAVWRDATLSGQLRLECPPSSAHSTDALNDTGSTSVTVNGFNDRLYQLDLRVRGLCVLMKYTGGSKLGYVYLGGTYNHDTSDPWWIEISDPPQTVRLNATEGIPLNRLALDYLLSVTAKGGATITLHYDTQDGAISPYVSPIYVPGVAPYPDEFDGHFLELTLVNSNKEGITLADLDDGPTAAQRDSGGKFVKVKSDGSGLEYVAGSVASHASSHASGGSDQVTLAQSQITNLTSDLAAKAPLASPTFTGTPAAPTAAGGTNTTQIATTAFVTSAVSSAVSGLLELKDNLDCSGNPNYPSASAGDTYYCSVAGKVGGASGKSVDVGDAIVAKADNGGGTEASVGTSWFVLEHNLSGALLSANNLSDVASASSARSNLGLGDSATKNVGTSSGTVCAGNDSRLTDSRTPTSHATTHQSGGGDAIKLDDLAAPDDNTDLDASTSKHGLLPKLGGGTTNFLRADGTWAAAGGAYQLYAENPSSPTSPSASGANAAALGSGATSSAQNSFAIGTSSTITGSGDALAAGYFSVVTGYRAIALGANVGASTRRSSSFGNYCGCTTGSEFGTAIGYGSLCDVVGRSVLLSGNYFDPSNNQYLQRAAFSLHCLGAKTTNGTQTELLFKIADGSTYTGRATIPNNSTASFKLMVTARRSDADGENDAWEFTGLIHRDANAASTTLDALQSNQIGSTGWGVAVTADTTNGGIAVNVTGQSSKSIHWTCICQISIISE
jgi:hypothetical protein